MALTSKSLFLYGFQITDNNKFITFKVPTAGITYLATMNIGFYSLTDLLIEVKRAMEAALIAGGDTTTKVTPSVDRTVSSGTQNRVSITTTAATFDLIFGAGGNPSNPATLLGFTATNFTGSASYTGSSTAGTALITTSAFGGYTYLGPEFNQQIQGTVNISATGVKEAVVFQIMQFVQVEFLYEPKAYVISSWLPWWQWAIQHRGFEFTPEITTPNTFYNVTLDSTSADSSTALAFKMEEMLPEFPNFYRTGLMTMRIKVS